MIVRSLVVLALLAAASPSLACPFGARCIREAPSVDEAPAARKPISLRADRVRLEAPAWTFEKPGAKTGDETPWIWQLLRRSIYDQLPRYRDDALTFVLSPVVVTGSFDTVPGVGLAGNF